MNSEITKQIEIVRAEIVKLQNLVRNDPVPYQTDNNKLTPDSQLLLIAIPENGLSCQVLAGEEFLNPTTNQKEIKGFEHVMRWFKDSFYLRKLRTAFSDIILEAKSLFNQPYGT